jgi:hypothetical protein
MSSFNLSDLELLSNRKKLTKYFDKEKLSQSIQIEQIIGQINNISKNDKQMPLNLEINKDIKRELDVIVMAYNNLNQLIKDIKLTDGRYFIENLVDEILNDTLNKVKSVNYEDKPKLININLK